MQRGETMRSTSLGKEKNYNKFIQDGRVCDRKLLKFLNDRTSTPDVTCYCCKGFSTRNINAEHVTFMLSRIEYQSYLPVVDYSSLRFPNA